LYLRFAPLLENLRLARLLIIGMVAPSCDLAIYHEAVAIMMQRITLID
jgi:hypothetical protein